MQFMMSFVSGLMLGVAMLHLLPHAIEYSPSIHLAAGCMLGGVLVMFFLLRIFHVHYHGDLADESGHDHEHDHAHNHGVPSGHHRLSWFGLFIGLAVHSLLDGVALAASVAAESGHSEPHVTWLGVGTFLAVVLHKPLDSLSITSLMGAGGWSLKSQSLINFGFATACPIGVLLFWFGIGRIVDNQSVVVGCALAFSAGFFLCIALSDLLPEVAFHSHDRVLLSIALLVGVALAVGIELLHSNEIHPPSSYERHDSHEHP
jgi:zinc and cadmium transporter